MINYDVFQKDILLKEVVNVLNVHVLKLVSYGNCINLWQKVGKVFLEYHELQTGAASYHGKNFDVATLLPVTLMAIFWTWRSVLLLLVNTVFFNLREEEGFVKKALSLYRSFHLSTVFLESDSLVFYDFCYDLSES